MIQHLEQEIELNEKHLIDFNKSVIRYESNIQQIIEHIEGPKNDSIVEELSKRLEIIQEDMVDVPLDSNNAINATDVNAIDTPVEEIKLN